MSQALVLDSFGIPESRGLTKNPAKNAKARHDGKVLEIPKIVLIDDDPIFSLIMGRWAKLEGIPIDVFNSLDDLGFVGLLAPYDVAIVDYDLGYITGKEVADYMASLFLNKPMIMISSIDRGKEMMQCPSCVKAFIKKSAGYEKIINAAMKIQGEKHR